MNNHAIPEVAVEAAAKALYEYGGLSFWESANPSTQDEARNAMRAALEAAAPHLHQEPSAASVWDEAATVLYMGSAIGQQVMQAMSARNPYRSRA